MKQDFAYIILPEAGMAHDGEGNNVKAFMKVSLHVPEGESYNDVHQKLIPAVAKQTRINPDHIQPIPIEEYED